MKQSRTTLKLTAAVLGAVALFAAAAAAGVSRGEDMRATGIAVNAPETIAIHDAQHGAPKSLNRR